MTDQFVELCRSGYGWISPKGLCLATTFQKHIECFQDHPEYSEYYSKLNREQFMALLYNDGWVRVGTNRFTNEVGLEGVQKHVESLRKTGEDIVEALEGDWDLVEWYVVEQQHDSVGCD